MWALLIFEKDNYYDLFSSGIGGVAVRFFSFLKTVQAMMMLRNINMAPSRKDTPGKWMGEVVVK